MEINECYVRGDSLMQTVMRSVKRRKGSTGGTGIAVSPHRTRVETGPHQDIQQLATWKAKGSLQVLKPVRKQARK